MSAFDPLRTFRHYGFQVTSRGARALKTIKLVQGGSDMVWHLSLEPLAYAISTLTWIRAGLLLLVAVVAGIPESGSSYTLELLARTILSAFMLLLLYVTVTIILVQIGTPRYTFWQVFPSAAALGSIVAIAFLAWVTLQERQFDLVLAIVTFIIFAPLLTLFFSLVLGVMPRLIGWR